MTEIVFLAGASGVLGRRLVPMLRARGWRVVGMTRSYTKCDALASMGAEPIVADVFNAEELLRVVVKSEPTIIIHQLTDLPAGLDPARMEEATARNARIRHEGTRNLIAAAMGASVRRIVAQSVAFAYVDGSLPHREQDALATEAPGRAGVSARGVASLENQVLSAPVESVVLRYGRLYGPGTGFDCASGAAPVHVDAAAHAAVLAAQTGAGGIYNIAEDDGAVSSAKAVRELNWSAAWRAGQASA